MKIKQDTITSNFFKTNYSTNENCFQSNNNENTDRASFSKTRSVGMRTQLSSTANKTFSVIESSLINSMVEKWKNEVKLILVNSNLNS